MFKRDQVLAIVKEYVPERVFGVYLQQGPRAIIESERQTSVYHEASVETSAPNVYLLGETARLDRACGSLQGVR